MQVEGRITFLIDRDVTRIEIEDFNANAAFCRIKLTPEQTIQILSRIGSVKCELDINGIDRLGKKHENKMFEFEIPEELSTSSKTNELQELAQSKLTDGWVAESYFSSQNSFFNKSGVSYARCTIRRWV